MIDCNWRNNITRQIFESRKLVENCQHTSETDFENVIFASYDYEAIGFTVVDRAGAI